MMDLGNFIPLGGRSAELKVIAWNTCGFSGKRIAVEERIGRLNPDVLLLQETLMKQRPSIPGFQVIHREAEGTPGRREVGIAVRNGLTVKEIGERQPYFCFGKVTARGRELIVGSVYIPCGEQTATMEMLGESSPNSRRRTDKSSLVETGIWEGRI
ncbi:MAG: uncharacterized protein A8A55_2825 [Amphiamblys sp. WSBS2006]|nr:MAG: uncharacterized protein A8A55_2825 [Amphiamblys sp. WSBS2006]